MKFASLTSGAKDSIFATYKLIRSGKIVDLLLSIISENKDSYMFHTPNVQFVELQASAMKIPVLFGSTQGRKEKELEDLEILFEKAKSKGIGGIVTGAIASEYQRKRIEKVCKKVGLKMVAPLWGLEPYRYMDELISTGFRVIITKVASYGLGREWLGAEITNDALKKLKKLSKEYGFHIAFEGGEAETFVLDCPLFSKQVTIEKARIHWENNSGTYIIQKASLSPK